MNCLPKFFMVTVYLSSLASCGSFRKGKVDTRESETEASPANNAPKDSNSSVDLSSAAYAQTLGYDYYSENLSTCQSPGSTPSESCFYFLAKQKTALTRNATKSKLVIFFSGGEMGCGAQTTPEDLSAGYGGLAKLYASKGYAFACAQTFLKSEESSKFSYNSEAPRVDLLVESLTARARSLGWWDGTELLISGVSHGATAPVMAMRHSNIETMAHWKGGKKTAACFFDGISDVDLLAAWQIEMGGHECSDQRDHMYCRRYGFPDSCKPHWSTEIQKDSMLRGPFAARAADFQITKWKVVSCGSQKLPQFPCSYLSNAIPDQQQRQLCDVLNSAGKVKRCDYEAFPQVEHMACTDVNTNSACLGWFDSLN